MGRTRPDLSSCHFHLDFHRQHRAGAAQRHPGHLRPGFCLASGLFRRLRLCAASIPRSGRRGRSGQPRPAIAQWQLRRTLRLASGMLCKRSRLCSVSGSRAGPTGERPGSIAHGQWQRPRAAPIRTWRESGLSTSTEPAGNPSAAACLIPGKSAHRPFRSSHHRAFHPFAALRAHLLLVALQATQRHDDPDGKPRRLLSLRR